MNKETLVAKVHDDWEQLLKTMACSTQKTATLFTQVDTHARNTKNNLEKTCVLLDSVLQKNQQILASNHLNEIQASLDLTGVAKHHWSH